MTMRGCVVDTKPWTLTEATALVDTERPHTQLALTLDMMVGNATIRLKRLRVW